nr:SymE family type I addiction module toxin [Escherichia coli]
MPVVLSAQHLPNRSDTPVIKISAKWLREAGFEIGTGVTVKISEGCLILLADNNEVQELRRELYHVKQAVKGMRDGMFSVLNEK